MADEKLFDKIIITDSLSEIASEKMEGYLAHALCLDGSMEFDFNGKTRSSSWPSHTGLEAGPIASSRPQMYGAPGDGDKRGLLEEKKKKREGGRT